MSLRQIKQSSLWSFVIALLVAAQFALAVHTLEHKFNPDLAAQGEECALCQVASTMAPGPATEPLATPNFYVFVSVLAFISPLPCAVASPAGFRSRAPPLSVSV